MRPSWEDSPASSSTFQSSTQSFGFNETPTITCFVFLYPAKGDKRCGVTSAVDNFKHWADLDCRSLSVVGHPHISIPVWLLPPSIPAHIHRWPSPDILHIVFHLRMFEEKLPGRILSCLVPVTVITFHNFHNWVEFQIPKLSSIFSILFSFPRDENFTKSCHCFASKNREAFLAYTLCFELSQ